MKLLRTKTTLLAGAVGMVTAGWTGCTSRPSTAEQLQKLAAKVNKTCPLMLDEMTRLDSISVPQNKFTYHYTLVAAEKEMGDFEAVREEVRPRLVSYLKTSPDMKFARDNALHVVYKYRDRHQKELFEIEIAPEDYNK